jgi:hypothetical protein
MSLGDEAIGSQVASVFHKIHFQNIRHIHTAISGSILDILDPEWHTGGCLPGDDGRMKETVMDYLKVVALFMCLFLPSSHHCL